MTGEQSRFGLLWDTHISSWAWGCVLPVFGLPAGLVGIIVGGGMWSDGKGNRTVLLILIGAAAVLLLLSIYGFTRWGRPRPISELKLEGCVIDSGGAHWGRFRAMVEAEDALDIGPTIRLTNLTEEAASEGDPDQVVHVVLVAGLAGEFRKKTWLTLRAVAFYQGDEELGARDFHPSSAARYWLVQGQEAKRLTYPGSWERNTDLYEWLDAFGSFGNSSRNPPFGVHLLALSEPDFENWGSYRVGYASLSKPGTNITLSPESKLKLLVGLHVSERRKVEDALFAPENAHPDTGKCLFEHASDLGVDVQYLAVSGRGEREEQSPTMTRGDSLADSNRGGRTTAGEVDSSADRCPGCNRPLRRVQVENMIGNPAYSIWCRSGFCSSECYAKQEGNPAHEHPRPVVQALPQESNDAAWKPKAGIRPPDSTAFEKLVFEPRVARFFSTAVACFGFSVLCFALGFASPSMASRVRDLVATVGLWGGVALAVVTLVSTAIGLRQLSAPIIEISHESLSVRRRDGTDTWPLASLLSRECWGFREVSDGSGTLWSDFYHWIRMKGLFLRIPTHQPLMLERYKEGLWRALWERCPDGVPAAILFKGKADHGDCLVSLLYVGDIRFIGWAKSSLDLEIVADESLLEAPALMLKVDEMGHVLIEVRAKCEISGIDVRSEDAFTSTEDADALIGREFDVSGVSFTCGAWRVRSQSLV